MEMKIFSKNKKKTAFFKAVFCGLNWARTSDLSDVNRMF